MASKKKEIKKKIAFYNENEEKLAKRVKVEKLKYRNLKAWYDLDKT